MVGVTPAGSPSTLTRLQPGFVRQRAEALVASSSSARLLLLHGAPEWSGDPVLEINGSRVHVAGCVSQLAVLDAYDQIPDGEYLVAITDRTAQDLGDAVLLRAWRERIELPDLWQSVPPLFGAVTTSRELRSCGSWVPAALLAHTPSGGWPKALGVEVSAEHALGNLLAHLLGRDLPETPDATLVFNALDDPAARARWQSIDPDLRNHLTSWAGERLSPVVAFALRLGAHTSPVSPLAVSLAVASLWNPVGDAAGANDGRALAKGRLLERHLGGRDLTPSLAKAVSDTARGVARQRISVDPTGSRTVLVQTQTLLADLGWETGAQHSALLPAGLTHRLRNLGAELGSGSLAAERALAQVRAHALSSTEPAALEAAHMAVRLTRWLETNEPDQQTLSDFIATQVRDGAWVDRACLLVHHGSDDTVLAQQYAGLLEKVQKRRTERDRRAAERLAAHTSQPSALTNAVVVEKVLDDVVAPWSTKNGVLLLVLDGMSMATATEITENATSLGFTEWVPATGNRMAALAALPSLTHVSRGSLFHGALVSATAAEEKKGLAARFPNAPLFHKDGLRSEAGSQLPDDVLEAIEDVTNRRVVGAVINTIDDTLHKQDVTHSVWSLERLAPLRALLAAAHAAGRAVVLTSDHGHVVEHGTAALPGGSSGRWRPAVPGETLADGEVLVSGPRVLTDDQTAVLLWRTNLRYGPTYPGYHGGANLSEITIPIIVLNRSFTPDGKQPAGASGWVPAPPQSPEWWNEPARVVPTPLTVATPRRKAKPAKPAPQVADSALFEMAVPDPEPASEPTSPAADLVAKLLASDTYATQKQLAPRRLPDVATIVRHLVERDGRAHRDTLAAAAGIPVSQINPTLSVLKRLLNVEGYPVLETDADGTTVKLDLTLLRDQFGL